MRVGLTGGIGSGKSSVAKILGQCGALVIDADVSAREAVARGTAGYDAIAARWPAVMSATGEIDRAKLGDIVFSDEDSRVALNDIIHPAVRKIGALREKEAQPGQIILHVVPLLFEAGFSRGCDRTIVVVSPEAERIRRIQTRDHLSEDAIRARMRRQIEPNAAKILATYVIENDGDFTQLEARAKDVYTQLNAQG